jgi:hypothetical protein
MSVIEGVVAAAGGDRKVRSKVDEARILMIFQACGVSWSWSIWLRGIRPS